MILTTARKYKPWWDTKRCRQWSMEGLLIYLVGKRIAYVGHREPDNDKDHLRW